MTGRENIYLNGAILGMTKAEIRSKIDEIIAFSGCERYIDTPVKRYSSGMTVRLAFSVAAHLEPDILIVDEVLAVGDAEFQKKAIGKMQDISKGEGRTVLFVSHNMAAIQRLCNNVVLLNNGRFVTKGRTENVIDLYLKQSTSSNSQYVLNDDDVINKIAYTRSLWIENKEGDLLNEIPIGKPWVVKVKICVQEDTDSLVVGLGMTDIYEVSLRTTWTIPKKFKKGNYTVAFTEDNVFFNQGQYKLIVGISRGPEVIEYLDNDFFITISDAVHDQEDSVINNKSGIIANQMKALITRE